MKRKDYLIAFILLLVGFFSRFFLIEKVFSQWDGPLYAIGIVHYSFEQTTPTFPGYPFYIAIGRFFNLFFNDPQKSILSVSVFGSAIGSMTIFLICRKMYNRRVALIASLIFLTGSTFYYFGLTAYAYILTPTTTLLLAFAVFRIFINNKQVGLMLGAMLGISIGTRPQEAPQIVLLFLLGFFYLRNIEKIKALFSFSAITLLWLVPIINIVGINEYFKYLEKLKSYNLHAPIIQNLELMTKGFLLSFGVSCTFLIYFISKYRKTWIKEIKSNIKIIIFYIAWTMPGLLINLLLRSDHAGYQMTYLSGLLIIISYAIWKATQKNKYLFVFTLLAIAVFNLYLFFYNRDPNFNKPYRPTSFHYSDIVKNDLKTGSKIAYIRKHFDSRTTAIITLPVLWMPYGYYLKGYQTTTFSALDQNINSAKNLELDVKNWHIARRISRDLTFSLPSQITTVVFPDDGAFQWIKNYPYKIIYLPGNSTITSISISPNYKIYYNYRSLSIIK